MSTWLELRREILTLLDVDPDASVASDVRVAVDAKMRHVRDRMINLRPPVSLIKTSSTLSIDSTLVSIGITGAGSGPTLPSFALTNFRKAYALKVNGETWQFISWPSWNLNHSVENGDQRFQFSWTIDDSGRIILKSLPQTGETWDVQLLYVAEPAAIIDSGAPEFDVQHEELFVVECVLGFPNRFQSEERLALFAGYQQHKNELQKLYLKDHEIQPRSYRLKPRRRNRSASSIFWGE